MKSYKEIADNVFRHRDAYVAEQKRKTKTLTTLLSAALCCCLVLTIVLGLWQSELFSNTIAATDSSHDDTDHADQDVLETPNPNDSSSNPPSQSSHPSDSDSAPKPTQPDKNPSKPTDDPPSPTTPPVTQPNYFIDSIDKINFYSVKKVITENSLLPIQMSGKSFSTSNIRFMNNTYAEYPIDRNKVFTTTMITYFTIELHDEKGFLAQQLGGTGLVEVVITQNNIDTLGQMITFKRDERYYTCFINREQREIGTNKVTREFSSHKYIDGFNIVKNMGQENYQFTVHYEGSKVVGFECAPFGSIPSKYVPDDVTFIEDFCIVLYTRHHFTIDQLEVYFQMENRKNRL